MKNVMILATAMSLIGCAPPEPKVPDVIAVVPNQHATVVSHEKWELAIPSNWQMSAPRDSDSSLLRVVLHAESDTKFGRDRIRFKLLTMPWSMDEDQFSTIAGFLAIELVPRPSNVTRHEDVEISGHRGSLTVIKMYKSGIEDFEVASVAVSSSGTGYVMLCGGDVRTESYQIAKFCTDIFTSLIVQ